MTTGQSSYYNHVHTSGTDSLLRATLVRSELVNEPCICPSQLAESQEEGQTQILFSHSVFLFLLKFAVAIATYMFKFYPSKLCWTLTPTIPGSKGHFRPSNASRPVKPA
ncbi:hypothetical protein RRG08_043614 [Elysia crispata]|uniref:Uncharacterized protein n=1 Tax=Elysia crispata TaxID=231223 RepID=A0AAE1A7M3_9GAST|nr:hypothetical protein RRG08_043614 [Elysia crispata]